MRASTLLPALAVLALLVIAWGITLEERERCGRIEPRLANAGPSLRCPTGYDGLGRCVGETLMGGVHGFLVPGSLAAFIAGAGGAGAGLAAGYAREAVRRSTRAGLSLLEALPRLVILLVAWMLWDQSLPALGVTLGIVMVPPLAAEVAGRIRWLEQQDFIRAARAHGLPEGRIVAYHLLYLSCGALILRHMLFTFGHMVIVETTLSYALQSGLGAGGCSWGYTLQRSLFALYDALAGLETWIDAPVSGPFPWPAGLAQLLSTAGVLLGVLWAVIRVGESLTRGGGWRRRS